MLCLYLFSLAYLMIIDVDECALSLDNCPGICVNTHGSFECRCISGYAMMNGNCLGRMNYIAIFL